MLPWKRGDVLVSGIQHFAFGSYPFLYRHPGEFSRGDRVMLLDSLVNAVGPIDGKCVVETGTDWTSLWGELLAERLNAKHVVNWLDENNKWAKIKYSDFLYFKYNRDELRCISPQAADNLLADCPGYDTNDPPLFKAACSNSIGLEANQFSSALNRADFNIGSIGRLEKRAAVTAISAAERFASAHPSQRIQVVLFGGTHDRMWLAKIKDASSRLDNLEIVVTGYMWPLPMDALEKMDIFLSSSGSCRASEMLGIPTVAIDVGDGSAIGFVDEAFVDGAKLYRDEHSDAPSDPISYLEAVYSGGKKRRPSHFDADGQWEEYCKIYLKQVKDIDFSRCYNYFDTSKCSMSKRAYASKILTRLVGSRLSQLLLAAAAKQKPYLYDVLSWD